MAVIIETLSSQRFTLNGIEYFKNYLSEVAGEKIRIYNAYDKCDVKLDWTSYGSVQLDGVTYGSVGALQSALLPVIYTRLNLGTDGGFNNVNNRFIALGNITRSVNTFTFTSGFAWIINSSSYVTTTNTNIVVEEATTDNFRIDIVVANTLGELVLIQGEESEDVALQPIVPANTLFLCAFNIFGDIIGSNTEPVLGLNFVKKIYSSEFQFVAPIDVISLPLVGITGFVFETGDFNLKGFTIETSVELYDGKEFTLKNNGSQLIQLEHFNTAVDIWFNFINEENGILEPNEIKYFRYTKLRGLELKGSNLVGTIPNLQEVTDGVGNNETTNPIKIVIDTDNYILIEGSIITHYSGGSLISSWDYTTLLLSDGSGNDTQLNVYGGLDITIDGNNIQINPDGISYNGIIYAFPTGESSPLATLADIPTINENFLGTYTTLLALQTAHPTATSGNYAIVDGGVGIDALTYIWDDTDNDWVAGSGSSISTTDALPEGTTNLYFTVSRVLNSILSGLSLATGTAITSADSVLSAFGKLQKQITDLFTTKQDKGDYMLLRSDYTLTNTTGLQKIFNVGISGNGSFNTGANKTYCFRICADFTTLSASSKTVSFGFLGTATITSVNYKSLATLGTLTTPQTNQLTAGSITTAQTITSASASTEAKMILEGTITVTTAGNIIPAIAFSSAQTGMLSKAGNTFEITEIGNNTFTATTNMD